MPKLSRRQFMKYTAASVAASYLAEKRVHAESGEENKVFP